MDAFQYDSLNHTYRVCHRPLYISPFSEGLLQTLKCDFPANTKTEIQKDFCIELANTVSTSNLLHIRRPANDHILLGEQVIIL